MPKNKGLIERLNLVIREQFGGKPNRLALAARISPGTFARYLDGKSVPGGAILVRIKEATGRSIDWLLTGAKEVTQFQATEETASFNVTPEMTPEEREYLVKLLAVLRNPATKVAIQANINTFLKVPKPEAPLEETKKKGGMAS